MKWQRPMFQPNIPLSDDGRRITASKAHITLSKEAAKEGMVLLKNQNHLLPFKKGARLALFGKGTFDYVKGGGGSGDVTVEYIRNLYEGFKSLGDRVTVFEELAGFYQDDVNKQYGAGVVPGMTVEPEVPDELYKKAVEFTDTAVITICRFSGEGWDRKSKFDKPKSLDENPEELLAKSKDLFEDGDFYLTHAEKKMVENVKENFAKVVVVMNVGGMVDTSWFVEEDRIQSVLMAWQGGMEGGTAAAELLMGIGNPSGKLSDTFAKCLEDYPSSYNFHESEDFVEYTEDIYVGYRYFETIPGAEGKVNYPFGHGLSYSDFSWEMVRVTEEAEEISFVINVINQGGFAGKEVIQLYVNAPAGVLGKAKKSLVAFMKTRLLESGQSQQLVLKVTKSALASFDDLGKIAKSAYVLEAGDYEFFLGNSVRNGGWINYQYTVAENRIVEQLSSKISPTSLPHRMISDGSFEDLPLSESNDPNFCEINWEDKEQHDGLTPAVRGLKGVNLWRQPYKEGVRQFKEVAEGKMTLDEFVGQMTDEEVAHLLGGQPNTGVANTFGIGNMPEYGVPSVMTADGPAGLRIETKCGVNTTAWPCATLLACTWNTDLLELVGAAGAKEVKENNINVWLTPAINIHRSPLCGRNFEYYSEDPFLTGKMAAAMVNGIQSQNIAATVKHFALNNKETNRKNSDSRVSERAAREIYLKAFEIIVKESNPWCIMTSYNIINGQRASENKELIDGILREEWGFDGMVTSDWWTFGEHYKEVKAGNDLKMACGFPERLKEALDARVLSRHEMEISAKRILGLLLKME